MDNNEKKRRVLECMKNKCIARIYNNDVRILDHNLNPVFATTVNVYYDALKMHATIFDNVLKGFKLKS